MDPKWVIAHPDNPNEVGDTSAQFYAKLEIDVTCFPTNLTEKDSTWQLRQWNTGGGWENAGDKLKFYCTLIQYN